MKLYVINNGKMEEVGELKNRVFYHKCQYIEIPLEVFEKLNDRNCSLIVSDFNVRLYGLMKQGILEASLVQWKVYGRNVQHDGMVYRRLM